MLMTDQMTPKKKGKKQSGGARAGAGRKFQGVAIEKVRLNESVRDAMNNHVNLLIEKGGKFISKQTFTSNAVMKCVAQLNQDPDLIARLANDLTPSPAPWTSVSITKEAYDELGKIVDQIAPLTPVYTNLSNVLTVILLKEIRTQSATLSLK
jgi:hypothetical protein